MSEEGEGYKTSTIIFAVVGIGVAAYILKGIAERAGQEQAKVEVKEKMDSVFGGVFS